MNKLLIHNGNIVYKEVFESSIEFPSLINIDDNISRNIISEIKSSDCEIIFVKDNLSTNYLELYGLKVAYHIRLSEELGDKRFLPIVIISDLDSYILNRVEPISRILFTKNIFLSQNNKEAIKLYDNYDLKPLHANEYKAEFLDKVQVEQPKDYLTHHSIANEWAMHRWSEYLEVITDDVKAINKKISSMLYFKYLKAKFPIKKGQFKKHQREITETGKILYIDDEWEKGWGNILKSLHSDLHVVEEQYKDKTKEEIVEFVLKRVREVDPDLVILDMRLHEDDFKKDVYLNELTGIEIFQKIKEINEGIQFIIFTASSNAILLEQLQNYDKNILSYIKKEHPDDNSTTTQGNINKLINKINEGLEKKYLKEILEIKKNISKLLGTEETWDGNPFSQYINDIEQYKTNLGKLHKENSYIFDILNSRESNKFNYALISLATSIDTLQDIFIEEEWDRDSKEKRYYYLGDYITTKIYNLPGKIEYILSKSGYQEKYKNLTKLNKKRNKYVHFVPDYEEITVDEIKGWYEMYYEILKKLKNRRTIKKRKEKQLGSIDLSVLKK